MSHQLYDLSAIKDIGGDDMTFIKEMVDMFATITPDALSDLGAALDQNDWQKVSSLSHSLKSNIISYGIAGMKDVALHLEKCVTDEHLRTTAREQFNLLYKVCMEAIQQMQQDYA